MSDQPAQREIPAITASASRREHPLAVLISRILSAIFIAVIALAVLVAVVLPLVLGAVPLTVLTGSMAPSINPGDVIVVQPTPVDQLQVGDVITFQPISADPRLTTHRVVSIVRDQTGAVETVTTRGDANNVDDPPIIPAQINGRVRYVVPWVGYLTQGRNAFVAAGVVLGIGLLIYAAHGVIVHLIEIKRNQPAGVS